MKSRILTALVLFPPVIYLIGWSPKWLFLAAVVTTVELSLHEYFQIGRNGGVKSFPVAGYVGGAAICLAQFAALSLPINPTLPVLALLMLLTLSFGLRGSADLKEYLQSVSSTIFGILYVAFTLSFLLPLRFSDPIRGRKLIFLLFLVIWAGDICAYFVGRSLGRHFFSPRISPKKTVEGAVAGLAGSLLFAGAFAYGFWPAADLKTVVLLSAIVAIMGQIGDLAESAMKRGAGMKDSGSILPGHGGMLDRIDALLFGAPTLWLLLMLKDWPL
ncbi:MAG: phosphatidate cytidylyltransferase [Terriglobia bacterium]